MLVHAHVMSIPVFVLGLHASLELRNRDWSAHAWSRVLLLTAVLGYFCELDGYLTARDTADLVAVDFILSGFSKRAVMVLQAAQQNWTVAGPA
jgi:hypothetical protein